MEQKSICILQESKIKTEVKRCVRRANINFIKIFGHQYKFNDNFYSNLINNNKFNKFTDINLFHKISSISLDHTISIYKSTSMSCNNFSIFSFIQKYLQLTNINDTTLKKTLIETIINYNTSFMQTIGDYKTYCIDFIEVNLSDNVIKFNDQNIFVNIARYLFIVNELKNTKDKLKKFKKYKKTINEIKYKLYHDIKASETNFNNLKSIYNNQTSKEATAINKYYNDIFNNKLLTHINDLSAKNDSTNITDLQKVLVQKLEYADKNICQTIIYNLICFFDKELLNENFDIKESAYNNYRNNYFFINKHKLINEINSKNRKSIECCGLMCYICSNSIDNKLYLKTLNLNNTYCKKLDCIDNYTDIDSRLKRSLNDGDNDDDEQPPQSKRKKQSGGCFDINEKFERLKTLENILQYKKNNPFLIQKLKERICYKCLCCLQNGFGKFYQDYLTNYLDKFYYTYDNLEKYETLSMNVLIGKKSQRNNLSQNNNVMEMENEKSQRNNLSQNNNVMENEESQRNILLQVLLQKLDEIITNIIYVQQRLYNFLPKPDILYENDNYQTYIKLFNELLELLRIFYDKRIQQVLQLKQQTTREYYLNQLYKLVKEIYELYVNQITVLKLRLGNNLSGYYYSGNNKYLQTLRDHQINNLQYQLQEIYNQRLDKIISHEKLENLQNFTDLQQLKIESYDLNHELLINNENDATETHKNEFNNSSDDLYIQSVNNDDDMEMEEVREQYGGGEYEIDLKSFDRKEAIKFIIYHCSNCSWESEFIIYNTEYDNERKILKVTCYPYINWIGEEIDEDKKSLANKFLNSIIHDVYNDIKKFVYLSLKYFDSTQEMSMIVNYLHYYFYTNGIYIDLTFTKYIFYNILNNLESEGVMIDLENKQIKLEFLIKFKI